MEDAHLVGLFRGQAGNKRLPLQFKDHSIKEPFDRAWKTQAEEKIRRCSATICLIGNETYKSDAVNWEIHKSAELGKGVMAVYLVEEYPPRPKALQELHISPVRWKMSQIMRELRRVAR